ncbi:MAG: tetratricopeptide repeat protein [Longimicrobiales bacterium]
MSDIDALLQDAFSLGDEGRFDEMADLLETALRDAPDDPYLLGWLGVANREMDRDGVAYEYFKRCLAENPEDPQLLALAGAGLAAFDDPEAETALRNAAVTGPNLPDTRLQYGAYLAREGLFDEALEHLRAAVQLAPDDPVMHAELGIALALQQNYAAAVDAMTEALSLAPDDSWTRVLVGLVELELGHIEPAAELLIEASNERPEDGEAQILAALAAAAAGWEDAAEEAFARAGYAIEPVDPELIGEVDERLALGAEPARVFLLETVAPTALHDRLTQPL